MTSIYTLSHSVDDTSETFSIEAVNEPPASQDIFNRKGSRGRSGFDIRHNFVGNVMYELPFGRGRAFGGWQLSGIAGVHSNVPLTPVLSFDNADQQSLIISERPNLIGDPYSGVCPNGTRVGTPACWFNPSAFALPPPGQFGTAGRNSLKGPKFAQFDMALRKTFHLPKETEIAFGAEAFNVLNHPNFAVPSNTQSPLTLGGTEMPSSKMRRGISPTAPAGYLPLSALDVRFNWRYASSSNGSDGCAALHSNLLLYRMAAHHWGHPLAVDVRPSPHRLAQPRTIQGYNLSGCRRCRWKLARTKPRSCLLGGSAL
jgi:hypothetical protein